MIRLATYNTGLIRLSLFGKTLFEFAPHVEARVAGVVAEVLGCGADVVALQEVFARQHAQRIAAETQDLYPHQYFPGSYRPQLLGSGLAILSKFPIVAHCLRNFKSQLADEFWVAPKAFSAVTLAVPGWGMVDVLNTHTTAGGMRHHPESAAADACRLAQLQELMAMAQMLENKAEVQFLLGDLNCGPEASLANYEYLLEQRWIDLVAQGCGRRQPLVTWDPANLLNRDSPHKTSPPQRIDHVLVAQMPGMEAQGVRWFGCVESVQLASGRGVTASDHFGVCVGVKRLFNHPR